MSSALIELAATVPVLQTQQIPSTPSSSSALVDIAPIITNTMGTKRQHSPTQPNSQLVAEKQCCLEGAAGDDILASVSGLFGEVPVADQQEVESLQKPAGAAGDDILASVSGLFGEVPVADQQEVASLQKPAAQVPDEGAKELVAPRETAVLSSPADAAEELGSRAEVLAAQSETSAESELLQPELAADLQPVPVAPPKTTEELPSPPETAEKHEPQVVSLRKPVDNRQSELVAQPKTVTKAEPADSGWTCPACTFINRATRPGCEICTEARPTDSPASSAIASTNIFSALITLHAANKLVPNPAPFECPVCLGLIATGDGAILQQCLHSVCLECLRQCCQHCGQSAVACPYSDERYSCPESLLDSELRAVLSAAEYAAAEERSIREAEERAEDAVHCRKPNCRGWCVCSDERVQEWRCEVCGSRNCLRCAAIHEGQTCGEWAMEKRNEREEQMVDGVIRSGKAMRCPRCKTLVTKEYGCDWLVCTRCQEQLCWATRGPRWGPAGKGDTSGGCRCNLNGRRCHPDCQNCH